MQEAQTAPSLACWFSSHFEALSKEERGLTRLLEECDGWVGFSADVSLLARCSAYVMGSTSLVVFGHRTKRS